MTHPQHLTDDDLAMLRADTHLTAECLRLGGDLLDDGPLADAVRAAHDHTLAAVAALDLALAEAGAEAVVVPFRSRAAHGRTRTRTASRSGARPGSPGPLRAAPLTTATSTTAASTTTRAGRDSDPPDTT